MPFNPPAPSAPARRSVLLLASLAVCFAAGCGTGKKQQVYSQEKFENASRHSRSFGVSAAHSCEAARRALLSHGYLVQRSNADLVDGRKSFQPAADSHVQIEFHVVCAQEGPEQSTVFVNALQDLYALKKSSNSASLGVGPIGSVSLPFGSSSDSLVKISSETIPAGDFYDRFFALVEHHLAQVESDGLNQPAAPQSAAPPSAAPPSVYR
ncbi:MAG: DUF2242 domain-containing protein [Lautropia sp.]|nr:DUF2242 domain-containing protein [Lautropia sp.]